MMKDNRFCIVLVPFHLIWEALVIKVLWGWFVIPLGVPAIGLAQAGGLSVLVTLAAVRSVQSPRAKEDIVAEMFLMPLVALAFGWVFHLAMVIGA